MDIESMTAVTLGDTPVAASLALLLSVAAWLWFRQRRIERRLRDVRFGKDDTTWLLREALRAAERIPRLTANPGSPRSRQD